MSAALQLPMLWQTHQAEQKSGQERTRQHQQATGNKTTEPAGSPAVSVAFYRRHTEKMLRRYLYASMQVGRTPSILGDPVGRGWASSRPVRTFEDAVIFVLDIEACLRNLDALEQQLLARLVLQEYTQGETAALLGMSCRSVTTRFAEATDRLTVLLLNAGLLVIPH